MKTTYVLSVALSCTIFNQFLLASGLPTGYKLELLQVIFRHGDRTALEVESYKTDPYSDLYREYGYGQLIKIGMKREYEIGQILRERYEAFLGDYRPDEVYAYSTNIDRTKMSLQLVLAGLYPPSSRTSWNDDIKWSPVVTHYDPAATNFLATRDSCARYEQLLIDAEKTPEVLKRLEKYQEFFVHLKNSTQIPELRPFKIFLIQQNLRAALSMGLPLPDWCSESDYKMLEEIAVIVYDMLTHTELMTKIGAGPIIEQFLKNINDSDNCENRKKIYLYSAHDTNLAVIERAHQFTDIPMIPDYGSTIIIEKLRGPDDQVYIRMLLWTGVDGQMLPLKIKNCSDPCPLSDYVNFISWTLPNDEVRECIAKGPKSKNISPPHKSKNSKYTRSFFDKYL